MSFHIKALTKSHSTHVVAIVQVPVVAIQVRPVAKIAKPQQIIAIIPTFIAKAIKDTAISFFIF